MEFLHYLFTEHYDVLLHIVVKYVTLSAFAVVLLHSLEILTPVLNCLSCMTGAIYILLSTIIYEYYGYYITMKYYFMNYGFVIFLTTIFGWFKRLEDARIEETVSDLGWMLISMLAGFFVMEAAWIKAMYTFLLLNIDPLDFGFTFWLSLGIPAIELYWFVTTTNIRSLGNVIPFSLGVAINLLARFVGYFWETSLAAVLLNIISIQCSIIQYNNQSMAGNTTLI